MPNNGSVYLLFIEEDRVFVRSIIQTLKETFLSAHCWHSARFPHKSFPIMQTSFKSLLAVYTVYIVMSFRLLFQLEHPI